MLRKEFKINIKQTIKKISTHYVIKKRFIYDFSNFYEMALKKLKFNNKFINEISILKDKKVLLNNKHIFDKVFIPNYSGVKKIKKNKKIYNPESKVIVSEHISILAKKFRLKNYYYSDFFNDSFDRVKIDRFKNFYTLTARLTFAKKGSSLTQLFKYIKIFVSEKNIIKFKKNKFKNYYRNKKQIKLLKNIVKNTNIVHVDTRQFVCGFIKLKKYFKR